MQTESAPKSPLFPKSKKRAYKPRFSDRVRPEYVQILVGKILGMINDPERRAKATLEDAARAARELEKMRVDMKVSELAMKRMGERVEKAAALVADPSTPWVLKGNAAKTANGDRLIRTRTDMVPSDLLDTPERMQKVYAGTVRKNTEQHSEDTDEEET